MELKSQKHDCVGTCTINFVHECVFEGGGGGDSIHHWFRFELWKSRPAVQKLPSLLGKYNHHISESFAGDENVVIRRC